MADLSLTPEIGQWRKVLPFWVSYLLFPLIWASAILGGWWVLLAPVLAWYLFSLLDLAFGLSHANEDPATDVSALAGYRWATLLWAPLQFVSIFGLLIYVSHSAHLNFWEQLGLFYSLGVMSGTIGINYSHEMMHQKTAVERWMADLLLAMVLYSHFRSEHLLVHHRYVGTPRDPVTARYNESFYHFFPRVLKQCFFSAISAERAMLRRAGRGFFHPKNPLLRYVVLQVGFVLLAFGIGGFAGALLFAFQAFVAVWQLELVNYVEHYGLTRKHLGDGIYEHVLPRHSWNAAHRASNWLLINLQRHSDHHYKPDRPYPLLQTYAPEEAPQLAFGYPIMAMMAMFPWRFRRFMNPKVQRWRKMYYPEIADWAPYNKATNPVPR